MRSPMIEHLDAERAKQFALIDDITGRAMAEERDISPAENDIVQSCIARVGQVDERLKPLVDAETLRGESAAAARRVFAGADEPSAARPLGHTGAQFAYASAGAFLVDHMRARGDRRHNVPGDPAAAARLQAAVQNQTTADTPGLLPTPIVGPVVNTIDASRPFITSIGALPLPDAGGGFIRPKITQHVDVGQQVGEKTPLPSRKMVISQVPFSKKTFGGVVDISRQDIDWTSPPAWDALVQDLADVYGAETEQTVAVDFATLVTQAVGPPATDDLAGWAAVLYEAAALCYMGGAAAGTTPMGRLPDRLWVSLDMWGKIGALVDVSRMIVPAGVTGALGSSDLATFAGDMLNVPRIVVPSFPAGTVILGPSNMYEFRETTIGLLTAVEPSILGVEVAYGGYAAYGMLEPKAYCKITPPAPLAAAAATGGSSSRTSAKS